MSENYWSASEVIEKAIKGEDGRDDKHNINYTFLHHGDHCTLNAVQMADNINGIPLHIHRYHDEIIQLMEGEGEAVIGDKKRDLKKGDVFFVPKIIGVNFLFCVSKRDMNCNLPNGITCLILNRKARKGVFFFNA